MTFNSLWKPRFKMSILSVVRNYNSKSYRDWSIWKEKNHSWFFFSISPSPTIENWMEFLLPWKSAMLVAQGNIIQRLKRFKVTTEKRWSRILHFEQSSSLTLKMPNNMSYVIFCSHKIIWALQCVRWIYQQWHGT